MPKYIYQAKTSKGKDVQGLVSAENKKIAVSLLKDRGYIVYSLEPKKSSFDLSFLRRVSDVEVVNFTQTLATMIGSGLPLASALEILLDQGRSSKMREIVQTALTDVQSGTPLSDSLEKHPDVFPDSYISLVRAGEASGKLDKVLERLGETLEKQRAFKARIKGAMIYPVIVVIAMVIVFGIIMIFVIPKLVEMYNSFSVELPLATRVMISISGFMQKFWYLMLLAIVAIVIGAKQYAKTLSGKYFFSRLNMHLPVFGTILKEKDFTEFTRSLALLVSSGVSIVDALSISRNSVANQIYRDAISSFINDVQKGTTLSEAIEKSKKFPLIISKMLKVGENTGKTDEFLLKVSQFFEKEVDYKVKNLSTAIEPLIMIVLGVMVALLIISVITPIYKLTSSF
ncbi:MAG TPA: type II secretion system F family protein [candidate division WWE3 bacterium]|uniref:Type II secretion system F family protein n=1 Tax=candidate division WWE3 bacterium TaxID=2053526 RepID=A0A7V5J2Q1_UNCKA|nr:type II secretion system F family protein [candidate division WWE3 bacterium]